MRNLNRKYLSNLEELRKLKGRSRIRLALGKIVLSSVSRQPCITQGSTLEKSTKRMSRPCLANIRNASLRQRDRSQAHRHALYKHYPPWYDPKSLVAHDVPAPETAPLIRRDSACGPPQYRPSNASPSTTGDPVTVSP